MTSAGRTVPANLQNWKIKPVLDALQTELDAQKRHMPKSLAEVFQPYWPAFTQQIRTVRNDVGHPNSIDPVTPDTVHAALLVFPEVAKLATQLVNWIPTHYK